jgi:type II secretory pathway component PulM
VAGKLSARLDDLKGSLERLSPREKMMLGGLGGAFVLGVVVVVGYIIFSGLEEIEEKNAATREALKKLAENRACYTEHRNRERQLDIRLSRPALELNRFVETAASAVGVSIAESTEISPMDVDRYTQRGVEIKLRKIQINQLAKLLKELEASPHIVQITQMNVTTRWGQHSDLDVELVVSTYEKRSTPPPRDKKKKKSRRRKRGRS